MTTTTHSHKPWTDKGGHVNLLNRLAATDGLGLSTAAQH
jgi:hypothetical protein